MLLLEVMQILNEVKFELQVPVTKYQIYFGSKFKKNYNKVMINSEVAKKVNQALNEILTTAQCSINGTHYIEHETFVSELSGLRENKWVIVPISKKYDIRICFKFHPTINTIEMQGIGKAADIGYKH